MSDSTATVLVSDILKEYSTRLGIDGSSTVLAWDEHIASAIAASCKDNYTSYLPEVTTARLGDAEAWPYPEDKFTHAFAITMLNSRDDLQLLRWVQYSLRYKGIAVLLVLGEHRMEATAIIEFVEKASFERGRLRVLDREAVLPSGKVEKARVVLAMKWDMLSA